MKIKGQLLCTIRHNTQVIQSNKGTFLHFYIHLCFVTFEGAAALNRDMLCKVILDFLDLR